MEKIAYLFGAGASTGKFYDGIEYTEPDIRINFSSTDLLVPCKGFTKDIKNVLNDLKQSFANQPHGKYEYREDPLRIVEQLCEIFDRNRFNLVDNFAKKNYILNDLEKLNAIKKGICFYFYFITNFGNNFYDLFFARWIENRIHIRYLDWLTSIMTDVKWPEDIRVYSYNYDNQVQIAYNYIIGYNEDLDKKNVYPINGSYFFKQNYLPEIFDSSIEFLTSLIIYINAQNSGIKFAWEEDNFSKVSKDINGDPFHPQILVVIGYSFPFLNREIDKILMNKWSNTLNKIYIQEPNESINEDSFRSKFPELINSTGSEIPIEFVRNVDQFHIPYEY